MFTPFDYPEIKKLFGDLLDSLFDESGRGALLIATAHVEDHLTKLIEEIMPNELSNNHKNRLLKYPGPLSSFSSKIELSYVFRLISENLYDSLNALRKIRNDAAHSPSRFELHELNEKLKLIYNLGPGFADFIKKISSEAVLQNKIDLVKNILEEADIEDQSKKEIYEKTFSNPEKIEKIKKQVPFMELVYGLSFLCGLIVHHREKIGKMTTNINTLGDLINNSKGETNR